MTSRVLYAPDSPVPADAAAEAPRDFPVSGARTSHLPLPLSTSAGTPEGDAAVKNEG